MFVTLGLINDEEQKVLTEISLINRTHRIGSKEYLDTHLETLKKKLNDQQDPNDQNDQRDPLHEEVCPNVYYVPLLWAADLVNMAKSECRITDHSTQRTLIEVRRYVSSVNRGVLRHVPTRLVGVDSRCQVCTSLKLLLPCDAMLARYRLCCWL